MINYKSEIDDRIDGFGQEMAARLIDRSNSPGTDVWPQPVFNPLQGNAHAHPEIFHRYSKILTDLRHSGYDTAKLAELFRYPGRTVHQMYLFMEPADSPELQLIHRDLLAVFIDILENQRRTDPFCKAGVNRVISRKTVEKRGSAAEPITEQPVSRQLISETIVLLSGYMELLYFANLANGREFHGPYEMQDGKQLIMREYYDLSPDIHSFETSFPHENIRFATVYQPDTKIKFDISGRLNSDALGPELTDIAVWIDNELVNPSEISELRNTVRRNVEEVTDAVRNASREELLQAWVNMYFWITRPFIDAVGGDVCNWHPPQSVYDSLNRDDSIQSNVISQLKSLPEGPEAINKIASMFDPKV